MSWDDIKTLSDDEHGRAWSSVPDWSMVGDFKVVEIDAFPELDRRTHPD